MDRIVEGQIGHARPWLEQQLLTLGVPSAVKVLRKSNGRSEEDPHPLPSQGQSVKPPWPGRYLRWARRRGFEATGRSRPG